jgi:hypothetical protein
MRFLFLTVALLSFTSLAVAAPNGEPSVKTWDSCVGENAQDYADMFGRVSVDADKIDKAVEDCWDIEYRFTQAMKAAQPQLSQSELNQAVEDRKAQIRNKWLAAYAKSAQK